MKQITTTLLILISLTNFSCTTDSNDELSQSNTNPPQFEHTTPATPNENCTCGIVKKIDVFVDYPTEDMPRYTYDLTITLNCSKTDTIVKVDNHIGYDLKVGSKYCYVK